jgi:hypothetical protein
MDQTKKRSLLELAAFAAGIHFKGYDPWYEDFAAYDPSTDCNYQWNPLDRSGDALELAAILGLKIISGKHKGDGCTVEATRFSVAGCTTFYDDPSEQMRVAIVLTASETGRYFKKVMKDAKGEQE